MDVIDITSTPFSIRDDITESIEEDWERLASPGGSLDAKQRVSIALAARTRGHSNPLESFAAGLYADPGAVTADTVAETADQAGFPPVVESIGIVARLAAVDRFHVVLGLDPPPLPKPKPGPPTGEISTGLSKRRAHVPMPSPGSIGTALDLVPAEGRAMLDLSGSLYATSEERRTPRFARDPSLNRPQLETVAVRVSYLNECFY